MSKDGHDSEISDAYLSDSLGRPVTPRIVIPAIYQNLSYEAALRIMKTQAAKSKKRVAAEAAEADARRQRMKHTDGGSHPVEMAFHLSTTTRIETEEAKVENSKGSDSDTATNIDEIIFLH